MGEFIIANLAVSSMNMKLVLFIMAVGLTTTGLAASAARNIKALEYGFCAGASEPLTFQTFDIQPYPVEIATGATIKLDIVKKGLIDIPFPCLEIEGLHLGSCEYDGQTLLDEGAAFLCPDFFPENQACALPLNPGTYGGAAPPLVIPEIPDILIDLLGSGSYEVQVHAIRPDGSEETCLYAIVELA